MTLQASGAISLGNIQTEFGGSNPISMSEYVKGGTYVPTTATNVNIPSSTSNMSFSKFYGGSVVSVLDTQTVTVGSYYHDPGGIPSYPYTGYGYTSSSPTSTVVGSISDGTSNIYSGATILKLWWFVDGVLGNKVQLMINGATNSGWTSMTINGTTFTRTSATSFIGGLWEWGGVSNPFGTSGNITVTWN